MVKQQMHYLLPTSANKHQCRTDTIIFRLDTIYPFHQFLEMKGAMTRPAPIPIRMDAINNRTDVCRNIKPTPTPITVVPPTTHELLSHFLSTFIHLVNSSSILAFKNQACIDSSYDLSANCCEEYQA